MIDYTRGGRGKTAPYQTTHCRIPEPVKALVEQISDTYKKLINSQADPQAEKFVQDCQLAITKIISQDDEPTINLIDQAQALKIAKQILKSKKSARISLAKLLSEIYQIEIKPKDLQ